MAKGYEYNESVGQVGVVLGLQGDAYAFSCSYDACVSGAVTLERLLFNFEYRFNGKDGFHPLLGIGMGVTGNDFEIGASTISCNTTTLAVRSGFNLFIDEQNSLGVILQYSYAPSSSSSNHYDGNNFTSYTLESQSSFMLRLEYLFDL